MEVIVVIPAVPRYMPWSEHTITWSQSDHPKVMPNPGSYALVVDPILYGPNIKVRFGKVLIDNGSSISIMYRQTMHTLRITENMLGQAGPPSMALCWDCYVLTWAKSG
jgi:hypothetical protein